MKQQLEQLILQAINQLIQQGDLAENFTVKIQVTASKDSAQGDFATNVCLANAKQAGIAPRQLAEKIVQQLALALPDWLERVEIAYPGFINFFLRAGFNQSIVQTVLQQAEKYGLSDIGNNKKIQIEFVSANPTGPLHVGHGRGAAYGAPHWLTY